MMNNENSTNHKKENKSPGPFDKPVSRNPLESLSSFVNSLELKGVGQKLSHSASFVRRSISNRFSDPPQFHSNITRDDNDEHFEQTHQFERFQHSEDDKIEELESTEDNVWLMSPLSKQKSKTSISQLLIPNDIKIHEGFYNQDYLTSNEHLPNTTIKTFTVAQDNLPRINEFELFKILDGQYKDQFEESLVVDCRFSYEYEGGHITNSINISHPQQLEKKFFYDCATTKKQLLVFHCEYSLLRGPNLASHLRKIDRQINAHRYPILQYPDIVVLERGYKGFFDKYKHLCQPQAYVAMNDESHKLTRDIEMNKVLQANKLTRTKSCNQFTSRRKLDESRSSSMTTSLTNSCFTLENTVCLPRSRRSLKTQKRDRSDSRPVSNRTFPNLQNARESPVSSPTNSSVEHDDLMPPTTLFRQASRTSWRSSMMSIESSVSSAYSVSISPTLSASESFMESMSPCFDRSDFSENSDLIESEFSPMHASYKGFGGASEETPLKLSLTPVKPYNVARRLASALKE